MMMIYFLALGFAGLAFGAVPTEPIDIEFSDNLQFTVHCREDDLMPFLHQIYDAADHVHTSPDDKCWQSTLHPPYCTKIEESDPKGAMIWICEEENHKTEVGCAAVADMTRALADHCSNGDIGAERAGGWVEEWKLSIDGWVKTEAWVDIHAPEP